MKRRDFLAAAASAFAAMLLYSLWASDRVMCHDAPCSTVDNVFRFMAEEGLVVGLLAFPAGLLAVWAWNRSTGRDG